MTRRTMLYGYEIQNGIYIINSVEAGNVKRIFAAYLQGQSYRQIAEHLNEKSVSYRAEAPQWDKHKVKRLLENEKYTGIQGYPEVISKDEFARVRQTIRGKQAAATSKEKPNPIWGMLTCASCGGQFVRLGGRPGKTDNFWLRCRQCGVSVRVSKSRLEQTVLAQTEGYSPPSAGGYTSSQRCIQMENELSRRLERCEDIPDILTMIRHGIEERYRCCALVDGRLAELTGWEKFRACADSVMITESGSITVHFIE